jgi:hypothetical protein
MTLEKFKETLGQTGKSMTDDEIQKLMAVLDYLAEYWLDQQEIKIFGHTIKELLDQ